MNNVYLPVGVFLIGLLCGSFLNSVIYRMKEIMSVFSHRSHCPHCKEDLKWYDLVPLFSFIALSGKCRKCNKKISWQYPIVELSTALLFVWIYLYFGLSVMSISLMIISLFLIVIFVYDLYYEIIPDVIMIPAIGIWILVWIGMVLFDYPMLSSFSNLIIGAIIAGALILFLVVATKGKGMGGADIKLAFLLGFIVGWPNVLVSLMMAFVLGAVVGIVLIIFKLKKMKSSIAFGPFLIAGFYFVLFYGEKVINWYLR
jgi:leader peptidase (prepilin peptidase)/N-methyltransferase